MKKREEKKKKWNRKKACKELDILWSQIVRLRDGLCRKCKKAKASQAAHINSRWKYKTRWNIKNGIGMCYYCHIIWSHREIIEFAEWIKKEIGLRLYNQLWKLANDKDFQFDIISYNKIKKQLQNEFSNINRICERNNGKEKRPECPF